MICSVWGFHDSGLRGRILLRTNINEQAKNEVAQRTYQVRSHQSCRQRRRKKKVTIHRQKK